MLLQQYLQCSTTTRCCRYVVCLRRGNNNWRCTVLFVRGFVPEIKMATKSSVRKSVLHNSNNSSGTYRPCGSVNFAAGTSDDDRHSTSSSTASSSTVDTAAPGPCDHLRRHIEATAVRLGCRGRRVQAVMAAFVAVISYQLAVSDLGMAVHRLCGIAVTVFSVACCFCVLALYLRDSWSNTAVYVLFATCFGVEIGLGHVTLDSASDSTSATGVGSTAAMLLHPLSTLGVLAAAGAACLLSPLDASGGTLVIALVSLCRYLAATMLADLPSTLRPLLAYAGGLAGVVGARYIETLFLLIGSRDNSPGIVLTGSTSGAATVVDTNPVIVPPNQYGRMPDIKRRRASSAVANNYSSHCHGRRISLPTLVQKSLGTTVVLDGTLVREAEGLLADMMADPDLPRHLLSGLRAVSNMLKTTDTPLVSGAAVHRAKTSPVVSLSECSLSSSAEYNDLPYADRPIYLPKRLRRSLPSTLSRCRSAGTWTTTTSATGMPSLESEPAPRRAKVSLGRSESGATGGGGGTTSGSPQPKFGKRLLTSDYESSDSPSSSEVGDQLQQRQSERDRTDLDDDVGAGTQGRCSSTEPPASISQRGSEDTLLSTPLTFCLDTSDEKDDDDCCLPEVRAVGHLDCSTQTTFSRKNSSRSTHITFADEVSVLGDVPRSASSSTLDPVERQLTELRERLRVLPPTAADLSYIDDEMQSGELLSTGLLVRWDYPVFDLAERNPNSLLSRVAYKLFSELGFISTFNIPVREFVGFFHALELGYRDKPYHNRLHATDVLHAVWYMTTQPVPGFMQVLPDESASESSAPGTWQSSSGLSRLTASTNGGGAYGVVGTNFPALELMALYTAAAMHDYDHPGRTNAFLVTTGSPLAVLYNDRSVLENHHAAAAWRLLLSDPAYSWLQNLEYAEFKRFRFLVIEAVLATDLKRHFDLLSEFNAKVNDAEAPGVDWAIEADRLMVSNMIIKMADINGPCKPKDLHLRWTDRITEEFYEQGDEEESLGLPISPYMNRRQPQLAKLQESFINHLVAPLCNALSSAGLLPGVLLDDSEESDVSSGLDDDDIEMSEHDSNSPKGHTCPKSTVSCSMVQNLEENHEMWVKVVEAESQATEAATEQERPSSASTCRMASSDSHSDLQQQQEMEPIREEEMNSTPTTNTAATTMTGSGNNTQLPIASAPSSTHASPTTHAPLTTHAPPTIPEAPPTSLTQPSVQVSSSVDAAEVSLNKR